MYVLQTDGLEWLGTSSSLHQPFAPVCYPIFPIYTVGPATSHALGTLLHHEPIGPPSTPSPMAPAKLPQVLSALEPRVLGAHTGNGAALARYILQHYNALHSNHLFTHYEAPRLPFIPLLGPGSQQYVPVGQRRLERDDPRLAKKKLLFLVGEQRRDVIPTSLARGAVRVSGDEMAPVPVDQMTKGRKKQDGGSGEPDPLQDDDQTCSKREEKHDQQERDRIKVDEVEVYSTVVRPDFESRLESHLSRISSSFSCQSLVSPTLDRSRISGTEKEKTPRQKTAVVVVVVFSPRGCEVLLRCLGLMEEAKRTSSSPHEASTSVDGTTPPPSPPVATTDLVSDDRFTNTTPATASCPTRRHAIEPIIVAIGPTTRDQLRNQFGVEPDVWARTPTPEGVGEGIKMILTRRRKKTMVH